MPKRESIAHDGPLNGIKITADARWDGHVTKDESGRYRWDEIQERWEWKLLPKRRKAYSRPARIN